MADNERPLSPQGYVIGLLPTNTNPFWEEDKPPAGQGIPAGGTTGQVLTKQSDADYDADWQTPSGGSGAKQITNVDSNDSSPIVIGISDNFGSGNWKVGDILIIGLKLPVTPPASPNLGYSSLSIVYVIGSTCSGVLVMPDDNNKLVQCGYYRCFMSSDDVKITIQLEDGFTLWTTSSYVQNITLIPVEEVT